MKNIILSLIFSLVALPSFATLIDFEDITVSGGTLEFSGNAPELSVDGYLVFAEHGHIWDNERTDWNGNGTDWFILDSLFPFIITRADDSLFSLNSLDAAEWDNLGTSNMSILGYLDGSLVNSVDLSLTVNWQHFDLAAAFSAVDTIEFVNFDLFSGGFDNINLTLGPVVSVAEPELIVLFFFGLLAMRFIRKRV